MNSEKVLIYDIETATATAQPDGERDTFRVFGCYSYITDEPYLLTDIEKVRRTIDSHDYLVGFNTLQYDNNVLRRCGFDSQIFQIFNPRFRKSDSYFKSKHNIDLLRAIEKRVKIIKVGKDLLDDILIRYDLDSIARTIGLAKGKIPDFDYGLLKKDAWTEEEWSQIREYTLRDIDLTKRLYEWLERYFEGFRDFLSQKDIRKKAYLHSSPSAFAYKALCNELNLEEEYLEDGEEQTYGGGYVAYPAGESFDDTHGDIYLLDFKSLYPHVNIQCNLFCPKDSGWNGNGVFKTDGTYDDKNQGAIEEFLQATYRKREEYKKNDNPREYALKIILNSIYGISSSRRFKHVYRDHTAPDCTALGRQWIMLARKRFREAGYLNIFSDTDSVCLFDSFRDKDRLLKTKDDIIREIKANVPFPSDTFDMGIDAEIANIWFFKGRLKKSEDDDKWMDEDDFENKKKGLLKKNYIYLTKDGDVIVRNLGVRKKSASQLTRRIFWEILVPKIKRERKVRFEKAFFVEAINELLKEDLSLAATRYRVNAFETYKKESQLQAQIARRYGPGIHFLIPNKRFGVGKRKHYCTIGEFRNNGLETKDIDLGNVWRELDYFIEPEAGLFAGLGRLASLIRLWVGERFTGS